MKKPRVKKDAPKRKKPTKSVGYDWIPDNYRVVALDVSSTVIGWAICHRDPDGLLIDDSWGAIRAKKHWDSSRRIQWMIQKLHDDEVVTPQTPPLRVVMEWQSHMRAAGPSVQGLAILGKAQGAVWQHLVELGLQVDHVSEREWTKINGKPAKKEVRAARVYGMCPDYKYGVLNNDNLDPGLDIADAIGIGFWRLLQWKDGNED